LIVEDHADTRLMYAEFLGLDYDVVGVPDGLAALEALAQRTPDIIVTDLSLPRMDGSELIERVRKDERLGDVPIIALSGYSGTDREERFANAPGVRVLMKPCLPEMLVEEVERQLRGKTDQ
jgi:two-component system cell cycle response regulator DivK